MKRLGQCYVQYVNRGYQRSGTLWEGRYRSSVVQTEAYVLACYRYIEMNPVRAGMVEHPAAYPWSSYAANAQGDRLGWLTPHAQYLALAKDADRRRAAYRAVSIRAGPRIGRADSAGDERQLRARQRSLRGTDRHNARSTRTPRACRPAEEGKERRDGSRPIK